MRLLFICIALFIPFYAASEEDVIGVTVDLNQPTLIDGVLSTESGGIIESLDLRIQAQTIAYTKKDHICHIYAEGDLILEFGGYYFIGESCAYDFITHEGVIYGARTGIEPWYFGGEAIFLHGDGSFTLSNGFITTSESRDFDWEITTETAILQKQRFLNARDVTFRVQSVPLLWVPSIKTDLETIFDSPIRYSFKWGSRQGARASMVYELFAWQRFKVFTRLDYRVKRGFGGGIETYYRSEDSREIFNTINYVANDNSLSNQHEKVRYRFQGLYHNLVWNDRVTVDLTWDKLSDIDMATDYNDRGLELDTAGRTQLVVRKQEKNRIERLITYVRVNQFQSVDQELPTLEISFRPRNLGDTGIISTSLIRTSFLDFAYANDVRHVHDYSSSRFEYRQDFFRPYPLHFLTLTPTVGFAAIHYGNSPQDKARNLGVLRFALEAKSGFSKDYGYCKHVVEPYLKFDYLSSPTVAPNRHYIFDIEDGYFQANQARIGIANHVYTQNSFDYLTRPLFIDLYTYGFFDTPTIGETFPKGYLTISTLPMPTIRYTLETAWDFQHGQLDYFNFRTEWTVAENLAIRGEYRHRSPYYWRKADPTNFILDAYRSQQQLLHSTVSDRRDTILANIFYQMTPNWAFLFEMRHGWNRKHEPSYTEFETDFLLRLPSAWNLKLSYQHREDDDRIAVYFTIGLHKPNDAKCRSMLPCLEL